MEYIFLGSSILFLYIIMYCLFSINAEDNTEEI